MTEPTQETLIEQIKNGIDIRLNDWLCEMKPDYDDSITGFNEAWDVVRKYFKERGPALTAALDLQDRRKDAAPLPDEIAGLIKDAEEWLKWLGETDQTHTSAIRVKKLATALRSLAQENEKLRGATPSPE